MVVNGLYGDGRDGDATFSSGTTQLDRPMYYEDLVVQSGATIDTNGMPIFCSGSCTVNSGGFITNPTIAAT